MLDPLTGSAVASQIGSTVGAGLGIVGQLIQNKQNTRLAEEEYQRNIAQWQRENEYNHPVQVMARMREAGINPMAPFAKGGNIAPAAKSPQYKRSEYGLNLREPTQNIMDTLGQFQAIKNQKMQREVMINQMKTETARQRQMIINNMKTISETRKREMENMLLNEFGRQEYQGRINSMRSLVEQRKTQIQGQKIKNNIDRKNWQYFRDYEVKPSDPTWMRYIMPHIKEMIEDARNGKGTIEGTWRNIQNWFRSVEGLLSTGYWWSPDIIK